MLSRKEACQGKNQIPVAWMAAVRETEQLKPIDKVTLGVVSESPGRNESEREAASKWTSLGG